jgi:hypothetical protein
MALLSFVRDKKNSKFRRSMVPSANPRNLSPTRKRNPLSVANRERATTLAKCNARYVVSREILS